MEAKGGVVNCPGVLAGSVAVGQYAFSGIWLVLLVFLYVTFYWVTPRIESNRLANNPFSLGPFELELSGESYSVRVGGTRLDLSLTEFGWAHDLDEFYRLDHKSGVILVIPKRALSEAETAIIETYRARFPGRPENTRMPDW